MKRELLDGERVFVVHDFLAPDSCEALIQRTETLGYDAVTIDGEVYTDFRSNSRVILDDAELADTLWQRASEVVPPVIDDQPAAGLNPRIRFYRYSGGEAFIPHHDGLVRIGELESKLTFMVYLSDVAEGGETRFYGPGPTVLFDVRPERGKAVFFEHLILHEGVAVEEGCKYVLRTDVMYGES